MSIAMVQQSQIDANLNRIHRFVDSVYAFKEQLDAMLAARTSAGLEQQEPEPAPVYADTAAPAAETRTNMMQTAPLPLVADGSVPDKPITPDDVDIDALLSEIGLDPSIGL